MSIQKKPKRNQNDPTPQTVEDFVDGAIADVSQPFKRAKKIPVALRFDKPLLKGIDEAATRRGMSRNAFVSYWCSKGVEQE